SPQKKSFLLKTIDNAGCHDNPSLAENFYLLYLKNSTVTYGEKIRSAKRAGDQYFYQQKYENAAWWYLAVLKLYANSSGWPEGGDDQGKSVPSEVASMAYWLLARRGIGS